ncbi:MAG TPA: type I-E CRISPR-associated protein Cse1/CasA [Thermoanaerobaculales bacterium]|nr:type I-E CRISPR-associated protein Cse1/CasA [Thermoanaerobaculales bacterium]
MNLIEDAWIPVARRSGEQLHIAPWQLTDRVAHDPLVMVAAPRPDFNGALLEFLIGLFQTETAPDGDREWLEWRDRPPSPEELRNELNSARDFFNLDGNGPRFMQSFDQFDGRDSEIAAILIDTPRDNTIDRNHDLFIRRGRVRGLCAGCTAAALYTAQAYSPSGGRNHRTSLRGGGPLSTVVTPDPASDAPLQSLWHACWLNVLPRPAFWSLSGNPRLTSPERTYPWLAPTRTSENGEQTTPDDMAPPHVFWGMPRRIRLDTDELRAGHCDVCGRDGAIIVRFSLRHGGMNYQGPWRHPLTPYTIGDDGMPAPCHVQRGGIGYRHWASLTLGHVLQRNRREPAAAVASNMRDTSRVQERASLLAYGYDVENAKVQGWYEYRMPVYHVAHDILPILKERAGGMILAADLVARNLVSAFKAAWPIDGLPEFARSAFWGATETCFFDHLDHLIPALGDDTGEEAVLSSWHQALCRASEGVFERWAMAPEFGQANPGRTAGALLKLRKSNWDRKIRDALLLRDTGRRARNGGAP